MTDRARKIAVVAAGMLLFGPVTVWRSLLAIEEERYDLFEPEIDCEGQPGFSTLRSAPAGLAPSLVHRYSTLPPLPALELGTFRVTAPLRLLRRLEKNPRLQHECVRFELERRGANAWVLHEVRRREGSLTEGIMEASAYLLHARPFPGIERFDTPTSVCVVGDVRPGSDAERMGFVPGDVLLGCAERPACWNRPCAVVGVLHEPGLTAPITFFGLRDGQPFVRSFVSRGLGVKDGLSVRNLPIADLQAPPAAP